MECIGIMQHWKNLTFRGIKKTNLIKRLLRNVICQEELHLLENLQSVILDLEAY